MEQVIRELHTWLCRNNIPREGVRLIVEFPNRDAAHQAESEIQREIQPLLPGRALFGQIETLMGIGLTLRARQQD